MENSRSFRANINISPSAYGRIITDRITRIRSRHTLEIAPKDGQAEVRMEKYRIDMLRILHKLAMGYLNTEDTHQATQLVESFIKLAATLANSKALAFPLEIETAAGDSDAMDASLAKDGQSAETEGSRYVAGSDAKSEFDRDEKRHDSLEVEVNHLSVSDHETKGTQTTVSQQLLESATHPLTIALLAYHLGGPVNAAYTARKHFWRSYPSSGVSMPEFHVEGGTGEVLKEVRVTVVWEEQDRTAIRPTGKHDVFLTGDATPLPLVFANSKDAKDLGLPINIIYDHGDATLYYDCQNPEVVRNSVSLDFHLNTITADTVQLLSTVPDEQNIDIENLSLTKLVTNFPVANYNAHFQRLLYSKDVMAAVLQKLASLHVPVPVAPPVSGRSEHQMMARLKAYNNDNIDHIPSTFSSLPFDIPLTGIYTSYASFLDSVYEKVLRDMHRPIGHSLFPQSAMDQKREAARKFIRDLPENLISSQLAGYANVLVLTSYTSNDLLTTFRLRELATNMERHCHELIALGFVDRTVDMSSMAAVASAFGVAVDGIKEVHVSPEPWVEEADLLMYRTRCLYLFWCVDWFVCYLVNPTQGPFMLLDAQKLSGYLNTVRREMVQAAHLLLRNWVAWGMFMESLPQGGFFVRQSAGFGKSKFVP
ncbi:hypothetical protein J1614_005625 [Plenodomus biglobosus]|nr:hypothetical protein J1614_005625 [Plenodomus biglobosus]